MGMLVEVQHLLLLHFCWATSFTYFLPLLFSFWNFLLPIQKDKKKKTIFLPICQYLLLHFLQPFFFPFCHFISPLLFTLPLYFLHYFLFTYIHTYIHIYIYIYIFEFSSHSFRYTQLSISLRPSLFSPYVY